MINLRLLAAAPQQSIQLIFSPAMENAGLEGAAREVGDMRYFPAEKLVLFSLGVMEKISAEIVRRAGAAAARWMKKNTILQAGLDLNGLAAISLESGSAVEALLEGLLLGGYEFGLYKSDADATEMEVALVAPQPASYERLVEQVKVRCEAVNLARSWAHEPANVINPVSLAARVEALAAEEGLKCTVLDDQTLREMGAGAIVAVGQGSATPSRLMVLEHPGQDPDQAPVVLVGKTITFDTGGYSLKSVDGMVGMKYDKCGGMDVIAVLMAAARLKLKTRIIGVIAAAENMVSAAAYRPNDIIRTLSGKTVEIISTDAEGRLVLCDALTYAQREFKPRALIDLATLTGGVVVSLGSTRAGLFSNNDALAGSLFASGESTFERLWRLPLDDDYFELIKGNDSDMRNSSGVRKAHAIVAATFLKQFVSADVPWAHLDIAGTADTDKEEPYSPKGATGFGVRLLLDYLAGLE